MTFPASPAPAPVPPPAPPACSICAAIALYRAGDKFFCAMHRATAVQIVTQDSDRREAENVLRGLNQMLYEGLRDNKDSRSGANRISNGRYARLKRDRPA